VEPYDWREVTMTSTVERTEPILAIVRWIQEGKEGEVGVDELYGDGPSQLGMSEKELRQYVNEGIGQGSLAIGGLASTIVAKREDVEHS
jgi:hypothetical protein